MKEKWISPIIEEIGVEDTEKSDTLGSKVDYWEVSPDGDHYDIYLS